MSERESFVFYRSFYEAIKGLPVEQHDRILSSIIEYAIYGKEMELSGIEKMAFTLVKPSLDSSRRNYENGSKGGRPSKLNDKQKKTGMKSQNEKPEEKPEEKPSFSCEKTYGLDNQKTEEKSSYTVSLSEYDTASKNESVYLTEKNKQNIPTLDEVIEYAESRGRVDLAESFFDYYDAADWHDKNEG